MKQSNKQSQSVKVVVNNKMCCEEKRKRRPRRRTTTPPEETPEDFQVPYTPMEQFTQGLSPYPVRPAVYAPLAQMIQPEFGLNQAPAYFDKQFTNQQATLEEMKKNMSDMAMTLEGMYGSVSPLKSTGVVNPTPQTPPPSPLANAPPASPVSRQEWEQDIQQLRSLLSMYQGNEPDRPRKDLKQGIQSILRKYNIATQGTFQARLQRLVTRFNEMEWEDLV